MTYLQKNPASPAPMQPFFARAERVRDAQRLGQRLLRLRLVDHPLQGHLLDHEVPPLQRGLGVGDRVELRGGAHHAGQQGGLRHGQLVGGGGEVRAGGRGHPVGAVAPEHDVEVAVEDLLLAQRPLELQRDPRLPQLPRRGLLGGLEPLGLGPRRHVQQVVLHVLLGQRRGALHHVTRRRVRHHRAERALPVHPLMLVEPAVLDRHDRRLHRGRDLVGRHRVTVLVEQVRDRRPRRVRDRRRLRQLPRRQVRGHAVHAVARLVGHQAQRQGDRETPSRPPRIPATRHKPEQQGDRSNRRACTATCGRAFRFALAFATVAVVVAAAVGPLSYHAASERIYQEIDASLWSTARALENGQTTALDDLATAPADRRRGREQIRPVVASAAGRGSGGGRHRPGRVRSGDGFKHLYERARPPIWEQLTPETSFALPSGHTLASMAVLGILTAVGVVLARRRAVRGGLVGVVCWVWPRSGSAGCTRVCTG